MCARPTFAEDAGEQAGVPIEALAIRVRNCSHVNRERLREHLELELATLGRTEFSAPVQLRVDCVTSAMVISAEVPGRPPLTRRLEGEPLTVNERKVSLAASELVADLWGSQESDAVIPEDTPPPLETNVAPPHEEESRRAFAQLGGLLRRYEGPQRTGFSGYLALDWALLPHLEMGVLASLETSSAETELAEVRQTVAAAAPRVRLSIALRRAKFFVGARVPMGLARLTPHSLVEGAKERSVSGPWASVLGEAGARLMSTDRIFLAADGFVGAVILPVTGTVSDDALVGVDGLLAGANLGIGLSF